MVTVTIGSDSRDLAAADAQWVTQEINGRRRDGVTVCVRLSVQEDGANVAPSTPTCGGGGGGGRRPNSLEQRILDAWGQHRLNTPEFTAGNLVAFLRALERIL